MAIPDYQSIMLPLLELAGNDEPWSVRDAVEHLAKHFSLTEDEIRELLQSRKQPIFYNRVNWARTYMLKAGLLEAPERGVFRITERGREILISSPPAINVKFLKQFEEFRDFQSRRKSTKSETAKSDNEISENAPEEDLEATYQVIRKGLANDILTTIKSCSPSFFEQLVVDLLIRMGYGGSRQEAGQAIGRSADEGIDGIIKEDRLGLDIIYVQAKRWEHPIGRPEVQKFAGALQGQRARKGVFLTTSTFSHEAREYVKNIEMKIVLIGGDELADLMIDHGIGVTTETIYELKKIDSDYFSDE